MGRNRHQGIFQEYSRATISHSRANGNLAADALTGGGGDANSGSGGAVATTASRCGGEDSATCVLNAASCLRRPSLSCYKRLNLPRETHCNEIIATSKPTSNPAAISIIDVVRIIAMMLILN